MREMSVTEQRYQGVLGVLAEGRAVVEVARQWGESRGTVHANKQSQTRTPQEARFAWTFQFGATAHESAYL
jgi:hypothetical protein